MTTHMVIGDPHSKAGVSNERFTWAGRMAIDLKPDVIICMGDFADMDSLCSYDKGKKDFEGRRYNQDIATANEALEFFDAPIKEFNDGRKQNRKAQYRPKKYMLGGNHEERINRAVQVAPELDGVIGLSNLDFKKYGWETVPYTIPVEVDGIHYCHNFPSGVRGEAISGLNIAQSLLSKMMVSCTVGHIHTLDMAIRSRPSGEKVFGLSAGCFFNHHENYAKNTQYLWWRGIIMKKNVRQGVYDIETVSMSEIERQYA